VNELISEYSLEVVLAYMHHIQDHAEHAVRSLLRRVASSAIDNGLLPSYEMPQTYNQTQLLKTRVHVPPRQHFMRPTRWTTGRLFAWQ
jgi:N-methylhydantoinase B/oxoprolinase/acetone carboxylase alpha subunit